MGRPEDGRQPEGVQVPVDRLDKQRSSSPAAEVVLERLARDWWAPLFSSHGSGRGGEGAIEADAPRAGAPSWWPSRRS